MTIPQNISSTVHGPRGFLKSETFLMGIIVAAMTALFDGAIFVMGCEYLNSLGPAELYPAIEN